MRTVPLPVHVEKGKEKREEGKGRERGEKRKAEREKDVAAKRTRCGDNRVYARIGPHYSRSIKQRHVIRRLPGCLQSSREMRKNNGVSDLLTEAVLMLPLALASVFLSVLLPSAASAAPLYNISNIGLYYESLVGVANRNVFLICC